MAMSKERMGEIAVLFLKNEMRKNGIRLTDVKRRINQEASQIGIPVKEAQEFVEIVVRELVEETFDGKVDASDID